MFVLGLTGSIGMGKSHAAGVLRDQGVPVHDADAAVHECLRPGGAAVAAVAAAFPGCVGDEGGIDRSKLGAIVFGDTLKLQRLEAILHPLVQARETAFLAAARTAGAAVAVLDIPLLFETGAHRRVDAVLLLTASAGTQRRRVLRRPGMTMERLQHILARQMPDAEKRRRADFVVSTDRDRAETAAALRAILARVTDSA